MQSLTVLRASWVSFESCAAPAPLRGAIGWNTEHRRRDSRLFLAPALALSPVVLRAASTDVCNGQEAVVRQMRTVERNTPLLSTNRWFSRKATKSRSSPLSLRSAFAVWLTFVASPARPGPTCRSRRGTAVAAEDASRRKPRSATAVSPWFLWVDKPARPAGQRRAASGASRS